MGVFTLGSWHGVLQGIVTANSGEVPHEENVYDEDDPEASQLRNPAWVPPLVNFTSGMCIFQWYRFTFNNDYDIDLMPCGWEIPGRSPDWLLHTEEPLDVIFQQAGMVSDEEEPISDLHPNVDWALKQGLAPGQPFLVEFEPPRISGGGYDSCNGDYTDVDVDYRCRVVRVLPKSQRGALKAWEQTLRRIQHEHVKHARLVRHFTEQGMARKSCWRIIRNKAYRNGLELKLVVENPGDAEHTILRQIEIAKGSDDEHPYVDFLDRKVKDLKNPKLLEQYRRAFDRLLQDFIQRHPEEDVAPVLALSQVEYSSWDYLSLMECRDGVEIVGG